ncbi:hypothetical protein VTN00DRAFT_5828 [Thermoascus crustaceus]|uniref:uncharacterized protein n=1 Tax=Thermoascus crustaceus TaxID=5088 RepID=UPI003743776D
MSRSNKQIIYVNTPSPAIDPSLSMGTFGLRTTSIPEHIPDDKVLVRVHYLSLDPAMRQWLTAKRSFSVGSNLRDRFKVGEWVIAYSGWQEYAILGAKEVQKVVVPEGCRPMDAMTVLGMTGLTAYFGMLHVGAVKPGDTVIVSGAAGATGSVAGQIAKIKGAKRVVGLAGSADKCEFLKNELGFDAAINYKDSDWKKQLKDVTPEYIDVFFDNVGGEILDACLARAARNARFAICGAISQYNAAQPRGPANYMMVISQRVTMKGFIVFDFAKEYPTALRDLGKWLAEGKIKRKEHIIKGGLEAAPQGLPSPKLGT